MISFETPPEIDKRLEFVRGVASQKMRPDARHYDEHEHEIPWDDPRVKHLWSTQSPILSSRDKAARTSAR